MTFPVSKKQVKSVQVYFNRRSRMSPECQKKCEGDLGGVIAIMALLFFVTACILPGYPAFALVWLVSTHTLMAIYFALND